MPGETFLFSDKIKKTNMYEWTQERTLIVTSHNIYNIHKKVIKRTIAIVNINGMTKTVLPSKCTTEFTIHITGEYDYRFLSPRREEIMTLIKKLYIVHKNQNCPIFAVTSKDLKEYTTTEKDFKKGTDRHP